MRMKRWISGLLALALCLGMITAMTPGVSAATGDEIRSAKKIISVVYDDSGSMSGDPWVYASYAMQALTALLNEQDELYITYMSEYGSSRKVDLSDIKGAVKDIRTWSQSGGTPGEALDTAKATLDGISGQDPTTQYWLVVMTDGAMSLSMSLQDKLNSMRGSKMKNGTALNVVYLAMGSGALAANGNPGRGLYTYHAATTPEITGTMSEIANLISGRITADNVKQVDDKTISFSSKLPLYSISVLSQESTAYVAEARTDEDKLNIDRNIALEAYEPGRTARMKLVGNAAVINRKEGFGKLKVIPAATYTITFSEPVDVANLLVQYEPAIGLKAIITRDGITLDDFSTLALGDKVNIEIIPVIPGTDTPIDPATLPSGVEWIIEYLVGGNVEDSGKGTKLTGVTLKSGDNIIRGTMQIPGFAPSVYEISFYVPEYVYSFGITVDQPKPLTYYRHSPESGSVEGGSITFRITDAGVVMDKTQLENAKAKLEIVSVTCDNSAVTDPVDSFGQALVNCKLVLNADGSYTLVPQDPLPFSAVLMMAGEYTVTVCVNRDPSVTATATFTMQASEEDVKDIPGLIISILVLLYLMYILFIKYKFRGQTVYYEVFRLLSDDTGVEEGAQADSKSFSFFSGGLLLPTRACRVRYNDLVLEAGPDGTITILGKSIAKSVYSYCSSSMDPVESLGSIVSSMRCTEQKIDDHTESVASDEVLSPNRPVYFCTNEGDRQIWRIYINE